jgi:hypothetical protein
MYRALESAPAGEKLSARRCCELVQGLDGDSEVDRKAVSARVTLLSNTGFDPDVEGPSWMGYMDDAVTRAAKLYMELSESTTFVTAALSVDIDAVTWEKVCPKAVQRRVLQLQATPAANGGSSTTIVSLDAGGGRRGHSGRKKRTLEEMVALEGPRVVLYGNHGCSFEDYSAAIVEATQAIANDPRAEKTLMAKEWVTLLLNDRRITVSWRTLFRRAKSVPGEPPQRTGGAYFSMEFEEDLAAQTRYLRQLKLPVFVEDVMETVRLSIIDGGREDMLLDGKVTNGWYRGWLNRTGLHTGNQQPLDVTRAKWCTSENLRKYYDVMKGLYLEAGVAKPNPAFRPGVPYSEELIITHPHRLASYDESEVSLDQNKASKSKSDRIIKSGLDDDGACVATKTSSRITLLGGRVGFKALAAYFVFGPGQGIDIGWTKEPMLDRALEATTSMEDRIDLSFDNVVEVDGKPMLPVYVAAKSGGMTKQLCRDYSEKVVKPAFGDISTEPGDGAVEVFDGCGVHISVERLEFNIANGIRSGVRPPHTSSLSQGEDVDIFRLFKPAYRRALQLCMREKMMAHKLQQPQPLTNFDLPRCIKEAWNAATSKEVIERAWNSDGLMPFSRKVQWDLKAEEDQRAVSRARAAACKGLKSLALAPMGPLRPSAQPARALQSTHEDSDQDEGDADQDADEVDNQDADEHEERAAAQGAGPSTGLSTDLITAIAALPTSGDQADVESMTEEMMKVELGKTRALERTVRQALSAAQSASPPAAGTGRKGMTSSKVCFLPLGLTGPEAMADIRAAEAVVNAGALKKSENVEVRRQKEAAKTVNSKAFAEDIIRQLETAEKENLTHLRVSELELVLAHFSPGGKFQKARKDVLFTRVNELAQVRAAMAAGVTHAAETAAAAREAADTAAAAAAAAAERAADDAPLIDDFRRHLADANADEARIEAAQAMVRAGTVSTGVGPATSSGLGAGAGAGVGAGPSKAGQKPGQGGVGNGRGRGGERGGRGRGAAIPDILSTVQLDEDNDAQLEMMNANDNAACQRDKRNDWLFEDESEDEDE